MNTATSPSPRPQGGSVGAPQATAPGVRGFASGRQLAWAVLLPLGALTFLLVGLVLRARLASPATAERVLLVGLVLTGVPIVVGTVRGVLAGRFAADLVATLSIVGALALRSYVAGLIIVLMQSGGELLERYAEGRASQAVRDLEAAAPRIAHRLDGGEVEDITTDRIRPGDTLLIRPGEMVPADAVVVEGRSHVDASRITGEPVPVAAEAGARLPSGSLNLEGSIVARATALARESQYERIVELVRTAQQSKAPLQRMADRIAVYFTPFTLAVAFVTFLASGDWHRVLAVLVVATPCPLILAAPVAIIGGINRAARERVIVRRGAALEALAGARVAVFDKTGTLTIGQPQVEEVLPAPEWSVPAVLRLSGALELRSGHLLATTVVEAARERGITLPDATETREAAGRGIAGVVDGKRVAVGALSFVRELAPDATAGLDALERDTTGLRAFVTADGRAAGVITYADRLRPGVDRLLRELHGLGIRHTILLSGDHEQNAQAVGRALGIDEVQGDLLPEDKVRVVQGLVARGERVAMVGDGTNDAPALASASVGIALAGHGGGITAEAADVVLLTDDLGRLAPAIRIARRTLRIARQSVWVGLGLSGAAMMVAAAGKLQPAAGALLQEAIDVAVIVNALRTAGASSH